MDIVDLLLQYMKTGDVKLLIESDMEFEKVNLNVIVVEILDWLKLEHKRSIWMAEGKKTCLKPIKIDKQYSWCVLLQQLIEEEKLFQKYFVMNDKVFDFNETIVEDDKKMMRQKAYNNYNPKKYK